MFYHQIIDLDIYHRILKDTLIQIEILSKHKVKLILLNNTRIDKVKP